ncbi:phosphogluconate dehydrogenase (NAD(+)-dependent, decarboxylating) [Ilumatobacter sp.]|uniref:phosphogluconate dehydrogenase (NAD(+)-dependent, decarboxylating) n=1 Tax=Ilumatobacter sp. TaxID=1967498 RepID=UPI003AF99D13
MQLGMIGLGRMGANMVRRLMADGHECVVHDTASPPIDELAGEGATPAYTLQELVDALEPPRHIWVMIPAAFVGGTVERLAPLLDPGDTIIDGGNSWYRDDVDRSGPLLADHGIHYLDVGTSGGIHGLERGYCLMVGGDAAAVEGIAPVLRSLAPGIEAADRTPGRTGEPAPEEQGWLHCGPSGAGHFVKMVHNGIEYGLMAAYAEGVNVLAQADIGAEDHAADAETAPLDDAKYYRYDIDLGAVTELWRRGSVVTSWLLDLTAEAFHIDPALDEYSGHVSDSGEGRWTIHAAIDEGVPAPVLSAALYQRFGSRGRANTADKVLSAMRAGFGGHHERTESSR